MIHAERIVFAVIHIEFDTRQTMGFFDFYPVKFAYIFLSKNDHPKKIFRFDKAVRNRLSDRKIFLNCLRIEMLPLFCLLIIVGTKRQALGVSNFTG